MNVLSYNFARRVIVLPCLALLAGGAVAEDLTCLKSEVDGNQQAVSWYEVLQKQARDALAQRAERLEKLKTAEDIQTYQRELREFFLEQLGDLPERGPLNDRVVGQLRLEGYRIEKVIFESQPHHHVTCNLYLPAGAGPFPGVLVSSGHSRTAKTADYNQRYGIMLAQYGMAALCIDPIGQGERSQMLTEDGQPKVPGTTDEHFMVGTGSILVGRNTATYRVWDAMRAVDYLQSRADIIDDRIGMVGCSGGGTLTSYLMALDDRITCAAPSCYLTTFERLIETIGPQDAEQNIFGQVAFGLDQTDYVLMRAPRPTLISSTTQDFFDIRGTWDNFRQSKRIYTRLGASERVDLVEAEGKHGVQPANLAASVQWLQRWLLNKDSQVPVREFSEFKVLPEAELLCTPKGQVLLLDGEQSVFDLNAKLAAQLASQRKSKWHGADLSARRNVLHSTLGINQPAGDSKPKSNKAGKVQRDGYHIDKLVIHGHSDVPLPALTFHPQDPSESAYLYVHDGGKEADADVDGAIEGLVKQGYVVVSLDLRGQGETANGRADGPMGDWKTFYLAYLLGESVVGAHTEDILTAADWVANYQSQTPREVHLVAVGRTGVAALHAAALYDKGFASVTLRRAVKDWTSVAGSPEQASHLTATVHGALATYDLPDLVEMIGADKVTYEDSDQVSENGRSE